MGYRTIYLAGGSIEGAGYAFEIKISGDGKIGSIFLNLYRPDIYKTKINMMFYSVLGIFHRRMKRNDK